MQRDSYRLSTKVGRLLIADAAAPRFQNGYADVLPFTQRWDDSFEGTLRSIDDSLRRLGVSRIDFVYIHDLARQSHGGEYAARFREALDGAVPALARLMGANANRFMDWVICGRGDFDDLSVRRLRSQA